MNTIATTELPNQRFTLIASRADDSLAALARTVKAGLIATPKSLPCCYFYDPEGSRLFEEICELPEYYLTRTEDAMLREHAAEIAACCPNGTTLVELGSGSATKTRILIEALLRDRAPLRYVPMDICRTALEQSSHALLADFSTLDIVAVADEYEHAINQLPALVEGPKLILWLGSNIGNLHRPDAARFLSRLRDAMSPADRLLVGIDLRKGRDVLEAAYDDSAGVTARFNLNLLTRINRELGGRFDPSSFRHRAVYDDRIGRIEMSLVSTRAQRVAIESLEVEVSFDSGEAIHTENSYKYSLGEIASLASASRLRLDRLWLDSAHRFCGSLFAPG